MCGITGLLLADRGQMSDMARTLHRMSETLIHRGPDAQAIWTEDQIGLGHTRLSILDLSEAGAQPMHSTSGRYVIVFNGEIYNHLEIRRLLEQDGLDHRWRGHSDTETLLAAIETWGLDKTLRRSAGMFALALWDRRALRLSLARDRMGEKPLYWGWAGRTLVFGSELKALRAHPDCPRGVCRQALAQFMQYLYVPTPRSIHPGLYKLEPGSILTVEGTPPAQPPDAPLRPGMRHGTLTIERYWSLSDVVEAGARNPVKDPETALAELERVLTGAVKRQMISDVPLGAFLSGGIDSSLIVALMQRQSTTPTQTFTIGFDEAAYDESPYAAAVAQHLGTDHTRLRVTDEDAHALIPDLPRIYDEPFADSSQIPTHLVCRAARQNVTVALSGDGGDELFGGYNRYIWGPRIAERFGRLPGSVRNGIGAMIRGLPVSAWDMAGTAYGRLRSGAGGVSMLGKKAHRLGDLLRFADDPDTFYRAIITEWPAGTEVVHRTNQSGAAPVLDDPQPETGDSNLATRMMFQDMRCYLPDDILCKVDRAAMSVSLETRAPFLDPEVIAFAARLPPGMKIRGGTGKWALRQVLYKYVPRRLLDRPKAGFAVPIGSWLRGPLRPWAEDLLSPGTLAAEGFLNVEVIRQAWAEHLSGRRDRTARLWAVLMFLAWRAHQAGG